MTAAQRWYAANKDNPEFKARARAAAKKFSAENYAAMAARKRVPSELEPALGERFEDWLKRWGEVEGRALFSTLSAARYDRSQKAAAQRMAKVAKAIDRVRSGDTEPFVQRTLASWRQPGPLFSAGMVTSVFDLGQVDRSAESLHVTESGGGAKRREGGEAPLVADPYKASTWRAPSAAPYALPKRGRTP